MDKILHFKNTFIVIIIGVGVMKVCVIAKLHQKVSESFYAISFEYCGVSTCHLGCMNVLAYVRMYGPVYMIYRSGEINYQHGYRYKCMLLCTGVLVCFFLDFLFLFCVQLADICC